MTLSELAKYSMTRRISTNAGVQLKLCNTLQGQHFRRWLCASV